MTKTNVLGIDQGIANVGFAVICSSPFLFKQKKFEIITSGLFITTNKDTMSQRITKIFQFIKNLIETYNIKAIGCEKLFFNPQQKTNEIQRNKSASIISTSNATGIVYLLAGLFDLPIYEFVPGTVKKVVTGKGNATKDEMMAVVEVFLNEKLKKKEEHRADAVGIGMATFSKLFEKELKITSVKQSKKKKGEDLSEVKKKKEK